ncbi:MAG: tetratricopeptide repeat protein [bacterium]
MMMKPTRTLLILTLGLVAVFQPAGPCPVAAQDRGGQPGLTSANSGQERELTFEEKVSELNRKVLADPRDGKAWNDLGVLYAEQGDYEVARDAFIRAIQTAPQEGDYHRNLGLAFSRLGEYQMAASEFEAYRRFDTFGGKDYWRLIGLAQRRAGMLDEAKATFTEGIAALGEEFTPEKMRLVLSLMEVADEQEDAQTSRDLLETYAPQAVRWLAANPDETADGRIEAANIVHNRVAMLVDDGKVLEESGLAGEAVSRYKQAYELAPDRLDLLPSLVDAYLQDGAELDARVATRLARDKHPDKAGTWIATAKVLEKTGKLEEAVDAYEKAFAIDDSLDDLRVAIGNLLMRLGRDAEAARYLKAGVDADNTKPDVVYNYAVSLMREGKYHAAIASLRSVVSQLPEMGQAWYALAQCLQNTKQYAAAIEPYERAYALDPDPKLLFQAASCAQKGDRPEKAIEYYQAAIAADPSYNKAQYNLALSFMAAGRYEEAVAAFDQLMALEGPSYRAYFSQGLSYHNLKDYPKALEAFELALEFEETPNLMNAMGNVYNAMGNKKEANAWYALANGKKEGG